MKKYERKLKQISLKRQATTNRIAATKDTKSSEAERKRSFVSNA
ncbi:hypothetical protein P6P90_14825 [Ectobacillus antri]|uniref:Uncharacterized protein n=1 Tax=Ectobacillus antri TaxID=2486280 RepID=A0ABT6H825_9BACI|nr:hypothetical protein [Ectobacillus antri]MDG4657202.1 hypothetical protein [Ectobacillus antri]MDG5755215.1 hypothetical protein [Ectobacillus antri]